MGLCSQLTVYGRTQTSLTYWNTSIQWQLDQKVFEFIDRSVFTQFCYYYFLSSTLFSSLSNSYNLDVRTLYGSQTIEKQLLFVLSHADRQDKIYLLALHILRIFAERCVPFTQRVSRNEEDMDFIISHFFVTPSLFSF